MPTLSIYIGENQISALRYKDPNDYSFAVYPYVFLYEILKHDFNEKKFYSQVIKVFEKKFGVSSNGYDIVIGTIGGNTIPLENSSTSSIFESLSTVKNYSWLFAESFFVAKPSGFLGYFPYGDSSKFGDLELKNHFSNKGIFPQFRTLNPKLLNANDVLLQNVSANIKHSYIKDKKTIILTGGRFTDVHDLPISTYLFSFSLFSEPGFYRLKLDDKNALPLLSLVNKHFFEGGSGGSVLSDDILSINNDEIFEDEFIDVGTLLKTNGEVEVLLEVEAGNSQFISLKRDQIFVFPLERMVSGRAVVSGPSIGKKETTVRGGKLGLIIDTRQLPVEKLDKDWIKVIEERLTAF